MEKGEKTNWLLKLFPIQLESASPNLEIRIKRISSKLWISPVTCVGTELRRPFNLKLVGYCRGVKFSGESWIEKLRSEVILATEYDADEAIPQPSGHDIDDVFWIAIASARRPPVGPFGWFNGRVIFSKKRPRAVWLIRRMFQEFWRTGLAVIGWFVIVALVVWSAVPRDGVVAEPPIVHKI